MIEHLCGMFWCKIKKQMVNSYPLVKWNWITKSIKRLNIQHQPVVASKMFCTVNRCALHKLIALMQFLCNTLNLVFETFFFPHEMLCKTWNNSCQTNDMMKNLCYWNAVVWWRDGWLTRTLCGVLTCYQNKCTKYLMKWMIHCSKGWVQMQLLN